MANPGPLGCRPQPRALSTSRPSRRRRAGWARGRKRGSSPSSAVQRAAREAAPLELCPPLCLCQEGTFNKCGLKPCKWRILGRCDSKSGTKLRVPNVFAACRGRAGPWKGFPQDRRGWSYPSTSVRKRGGEPRVPGPLRVPVGRGRARWLELAEPRPPLSNPGWLLRLLLPL